VFYKETVMTDTFQIIEKMAKECRDASLSIAGLSTAKKNEALLEIAAQLMADEEKIIKANVLDISAGRGKGLSEAMLDRLSLNHDRLEKMAEAIREIASLPDPIGEISEMITRSSGISVGKMRIPLGVIAMIYEARPNVTSDAAALCLKAGNSVILRGGSEAFNSNQAIAGSLRTALSKKGLPAAAVSLLPSNDRKAIAEMLTLDKYIDLVIPRGGEGLIRYVAETSRIPVIMHYKGVCHLFVDESADADMARNILIDGKTSRPGVCNSLETLLVHEKAGARLLPVLGKSMAERGVEIRGCPMTCARLPEAIPAVESDWGAEYLSLTLAVKVVGSMDEAITHIRKYGSNHTEVIVTNDLKNSNGFIRAINSSVVMVNASSRFSDGGEFGLGAEIGISTSKLHAYGPMGVKSLTTQKFIVMGQGETRHPV
jgi:glutamate-5-semialdehyde dehydrogenase